MWGFWDESEVLSVADVSCKDSQNISKENKVGEKEKVSLDECRISLRRLWILIIVTRRFSLHQSSREEFDKKQETFVIVNKQVSIQFQPASERLCIRS